MNYHLPTFPDIHKYILLVSIHIGLLSWSETTMTACEQNQPGNAELPTDWNNKQIDCVYSLHTDAAILLILDIRLMNRYCMIHPETRFFKCAVGLTVNMVSFSELWEKNGRWVMVYRFKRIRQFLYNTSELATLNTHHDVYTLLEIGIIVFI